MTTHVKPEDKLAEEKAAAHEKLQHEKAQQEKAAKEKAAKEKDRGVPVAPGDELTDAKYPRGKGSDPEPAKPTKE